MFSSIEQIAERFIEVLGEHSRDQKPIDAKDLSMRFSADVIGSVAFGIENNCLGGESELFRIVKILIDSFKFSNVSLIFKMTFQDLSRKLGLAMTPPEVSSYFMKILQETVDYREKNNVVRNDFLQLLLQLKDKGFLDGETEDHDAEKLTYNQIAAQAFVSFSLVDWWVK